jgi:hypothetical protein
MAQFSVLAPLNYEEFGGSCVDLNQTRLASLEPISDFVETDDDLAWWVEAAKAQRARKKPPH